MRRTPKHSRTWRRSKRLDKRWCFIFLSDISFYGWIPNWGVFHYHLNKRMYVLVFHTCVSRSPKFIVLFGRICHLVRCQGWLFNADVISLLTALILKSSTKLKSQWSSRDQAMCLRSMSFSIKCSQKSILRSFIPPWRLGEEIDKCVK